MNNPEIFNQTILNQITSEIVVLDKDLKVVWVNDSAITNNWKISDKHTDACLVWVWERADILR